MLSRSAAFISLLICAWMVISPVMQHWDQCSDHGISSPVSEIPLENCSSDELEDKNFILEISRVKATQSTQGVEHTNVFHLEVQLTSPLDPPEFQA